MSSISTPWHLGALGLGAGNPRHLAGLSGHGVIIAVLDTGVDATHPTLTGRVVAA